MNEQNVVYIGEVTHIPDALRFWVEMWCFPLSLSLVGRGALAHDSPTLSINCGML